jgi:hypothetical protein
LQLSRIELLRGNAEEAIRLNVREIEALQVHFVWLNLKNPLPLIIFSGCRSSTFGPKGHVCQ